MKKKDRKPKPEPRIAITARAVTISTQRVKRRHKPASALVNIAGGPARGHSGRKRLIMTVRGAATSGVTFLRRTDTMWRGLDDYYREYIRNFLVRGSIDARAFWATKEGFETKIGRAHV